MIKTRMLLAMGLGATIAVATPTLTPLYADDMSGMKMPAATEKGEKSEKKMKMPTTAEGIWQEIHKHHGELDEVVKSKKLDQVHHHAFEIRDLAKGLVAKAPAKNKMAVKSAVKHIAKLAQELDKSGDANDQVATEVNLKKLDGEIQELEAQFPKH